VGWHNDWNDAQRDARAARSDKPVARGDISRRAVVVAALIAGTATVPLSLLSGWRAGAAHIGALALALAYNARLKATVASFVPYFFAFPLLLAFISLGRHADRWPAWWALLGAALLGTGAHLANAAPDVAHDNQSGIRGLPQRMGARRSIEGALALMAASTSVIVIGGVFGAGPDHSVGGADEVAALVVPAALLASVLLLWLSRTRRQTALEPRGAPGTRVWFRVTMVVALANVALILARGASL
jgi:4-hydroxybenzoate polyprenyltransferase